MEAKVNERLEIRLATPERPYVKVYLDCMDSELLSKNEFNVFIAMKSYLNYGSNTGDVFPSLENIAKRSHLNIKTVVKTIDNLEKKKVIEKKRRGLTKTNLYTLNDSPEIWSRKTIEEVAEMEKKNLEESEVKLKDADADALIKELKKRGFEILEKKDNKQDSKQDKQNKEKKEQKKELAQTDQSLTSSLSNKISLENTEDVNTSNGSFVVSNNNEEKIKSQEKIEKVKKLFTINNLKDKKQYEMVVSSTEQKYADVVFDVIWKYLNINSMVKVGGESYTSDAIKYKISMLTTEEIIFVVNQYRHQTGVIKNPDKYILKQLLKAKEQYKLHQINKDRESAPISQNNNNNTTDTPTMLPTCEKHINNKNTFNNFEQRKYDYDAIYEQYMKNDNKDEK